MKRHWELFKANMALCGAIVGLVLTIVGIVILVASVAVAVALPWLVALWLILQIF